MVSPLMQIQFPDITTAICPPIPIESARATFGMQFIAQQYWSEAIRFLPSLKMQSELISDDAATAVHHGRIEELARG